MNIGLMDIDGHHFPNLVLMKLSAYHKAKGDSVEWWNGIQYYDRVYKAKVFTFTQDVQTCIQADEIIEGGTGYSLSTKLLEEVEYMIPDYSIYPQYREAYGYLTRGCPRQCMFCVVSEKEGAQSRKVANLNQFWTGQREVKLLDPNLLAYSEHLELIQQLADSRAWIDFTQGLDARCITRSNAESLSNIRMKMAHFAFDSVKDETAIVQGLEMFKKVTGIEERKTGVYILTNFGTTHEEDMHRVRVIQRLGFMPYIMIYEKETAPQVTRDLQRWCNNRIIHRASGMDFSNYRKII